MKDLIHRFEKEIMEGRVTRVTDDSRKVVPGSAFVAIKGSVNDSHRFLEDAFEKGASFLVGEEDAPTLPAHVYLKVVDSKAALGWMASRIHDHPSRALKMIGITGTSGKTTNAYLLHSIFTAAGEKTGLIGTVKIHLGQTEISSTLTTPGTVQLQETLARMRDEGCATVVMEASSHSLRQKRVYGVAWDAVLFLNLTPEHLDYHPDMQDYFEAKKLLFTKYVKDSIAAGKYPVGCIMHSGEWSDRLMNDCLNAPIPGFRVHWNLPYTLKASVSGIEGQVGGIPIRSSLLGELNAMNIAASASLARFAGISDSAISKGIATLPFVPGRMQPVPNQKGIHVFVDYAHKPDALEKALLSARALRDEFGNGKLICVFGCGGDRDRTKRPKMGAIASKLSDHVIVTSDNPRTEDPAKIVQEIVGGMTNSSNFEVEIDRKLAIEKGIASCSSGDFVLIAGKGHEDYQIIGINKNPFDDHRVALDCLTRQTRSP